VPIWSNHPAHSTQLVDEIETKFQRLPRCFGVKQSNEINENAVRPIQKLEIQYGGFLIGYQVWKPPTWISHFRLSRITSPIVLLDRSTPKTSIWLLKFGFYFANQLIKVFKLKCWSEVRHLELILSVRSYSICNGSFGFSFR